MLSFKDCIKKIAEPLVKFFSEKIETSDELAAITARAIPAHCPFARTISLPFGKQICIPPLCKLNPLYDELVALRFLALLTLERHHKDITSLI
jgi:hypothetical protein